MKFVKFSWANLKQFGNWSNVELYYINLVYKYGYSLSTNLVIFKKFSNFLFIPRKHYNMKCSKAKDVYLFEVNGTLTVCILISDRCYYII